MASIFLLRLIGPLFSYKWFWKANYDQCHEIDFSFVYCLACTKEYQQTKMLGSLFLKIGVTGLQKRVQSVWDL